MKRCGCHRCTTAEQAVWDDIFWSLVGDIVITDYPCPECDIEPFASDAALARHMDQNHHKQGSTRRACWGGFYEAEERYPDLYPDSPDNPYRRT